MSTTGRDISSGYVERFGPYKRSLIKDEEILSLYEVYGVSPRVEQYLQQTSHRRKSVSPTTELVQSNLHNDCDALNQSRIYMQMELVRVFLD